MSDFDELFNSIQKSNIVDIIRDSKIELVTEFDANHPLKTGEYFYDEESNTLYVGAGQVMGYSHLSIVDFLTKRVSYKYIPAPRYKVEISAIELKAIKDTTIIFKPAPRTRFNKDINFVTNRDTKTKITTKNTVTVINNISVCLDYNTEVYYG